nr:protein BUD31 homolog isoform X1 [Aotus nancymaae]
MRERGKWNLCGPSSGSTTRKPAISLTSFTSGKLSAENSMNIVLKKAMQTKTSSQNGKSKDMRTCAACGAFRHGTPTLGQTASAAYPKASWKWAASSSAHTAAAVAALAEAGALHPGLWTSRVPACGATRFLGAASSAPGLSWSMVSTGKTSLSISCDF